MKTWMNGLAAALTLLPLAAGTALAQAPCLAGGTLTIGFGPDRPQPEDRELAGGDMGADAPGRQAGRAAGRPGDGHLQSLVEGEGWGMTAYQ